MTTPTLGGTDKSRGPVAPGGAQGSGGRPGAVSYGLGIALAVAAAVGAGCTFFVDGILGGPAVSNGNARGTALIVLVVGVPVLAGAMTLTARGSLRALVVWLGVTCYLLYNAVMFVFATPFNRLFLVYVAMLSFALWSIVAVLVQTDVAAFGRHVSPDLPAHGIAIYAWVIVGLNVAIWLKTIVPATFDSSPTSFLDGSGMTTNPVFVQDLAVWLPVAAVAAAWLWWRRPWGALVIGAVLTMGVLESVGVATDQWFGHQADAHSSFASAAMVPAFGVLAVIGLVPLAFFYRHLDVSR